MPDTTMLDLQMLKQLEGDFLLRYPNGFNDPEMLAISKKHKMPKMVEMAQTCFKKRAFGNIHVTADNMVKMIGRSSMISMFEKPKFRDFVKNLGENDKAFLVKALYQMIHGKQALGFEAMVDILRTEKLAKWSLLTILPAYYAPHDEVFIKPTTAKAILAKFAITDLIYKPTPTWDFYQHYRQLMNEAKKNVAAELSPSNAAFSGFLMMTAGAK
jgi:hypothetical protein